MPRYNDMNHVTKLLCCLVPNIGIAMGSIILTFSEASGTGLQWDNIGHPATPDDTLSLSMTFTMFVVDGIICLLLTWYIEAVFPGEYGVPEYWRWKEHFKPALEGKDTFEEKEENIIRTPQEEEMEPPSIDEQ
ncbi:ATP-binding cassette sub-family A member 3 [Trichonephila clavipes]|nr:ATP-binding cassette sub-family A member 3 [Trichonephila clavipes]